MIIFINRLIVGIGAGRLAELHLRILSCPFLRFFSKRKACRKDHITAIIHQLLQNTLLASLRHIKLRDRLHLPGVFLFNCLLRLDKITCIGGTGISHIDKADSDLSLLCVIPHQYMKAERRQYNEQCAAKCDQIYSLHTMPLFLL